jgi:hypothetical protein
MCDIEIEIHWTPTCVGDDKRAILLPEAGVSLFPDFPVTGRIAEFNSFIRRGDGTRIGLHCPCGPARMCQLVPWHMFVKTEYHLLGMKYEAVEYWRTMRVLRRVLLKAVLRRRIKRIMKPLVEAYWAPEGKGGKREHRDIHAMLEKVGLADMKSAESMRE